MIFDVKALFGGFYNLLALRASVAAFGADVDYHQAHVMDILELQLALRSDLVSPV